MACSFCCLTGREEVCRSQREGGQRLHPVRRTQGIGQAGNEEAEVSGGEVGAGGLHRAPATGHQLLNGRDHVLKPTALYNILSKLNGGYSSSAFCDSILPLCLEGDTVLFILFILMAIVGCFFFFLHSSDAAADRALRIYDRDKLCLSLT